MFLLKVRRADTPLYAVLRRFALYWLNFSFPLPHSFLRFISPLYHLHVFSSRAINRVITVFYRDPLFRSQCETIGARVYMERMPVISGNLELHFGTDVVISGNLGLGAMRVYERPVISIGNNVFLGHGVGIQAAQKIVIEDGVAIAANCYISDSDGHPRDLQQRLKGMPPPPAEVMPVRICRNAWIGRGACVLKGVTIGPGAIIGAGSIVLCDVPAYATAMGSPARVISVPSRIQQPKSVPPSNDRIAATTGTEG